MSLTLSFLTLAPLHTHTPIIIFTENSSLFVVSINNEQRTPLPNTVVFAFAILPSQYEWRQENSHLKSAISLLFTCLRARNIHHRALPVITTLWVSFHSKLEFLIACYKLNCIQGASSQCFRRPPFRRFSVSLQCKTIALPFFILNNIHTNTLIHSVILRHSEICSRVKCKITLLQIRCHTDELNRYHKQSTIFHHSQTKRFITNII